MEPQDDGILGNYGRDGQRLVTSAADHAVFRTRKGGVSHNYNGSTGNWTSDFKRMVLTPCPKRPTFTFQLPHGSPLTLPLVVGNERFAGTSPTLDIRSS